MPLPEFPELPKFCEPSPEFPEFPKFCVVGVVPIPEFPEFPEFCVPNPEFPEFPKFCVVGVVPIPEFPVDPELPEDPEPAEALKSPAKYQLPFSFTSCADELAPVNRVQYDAPEQVIVAVAWLPSVATATVASVILGNASEAD